MARKLTFIYFAKDRFTEVTKKINRTVKDTREKMKAAKESMLGGALAAQTAGQKVAQSGKKAAETSKLLSVAGGTLAAKFAPVAATLAAAFGAGAIFKKGAALQDSIAELSAITGVAGDQLGDLQNRITQLGIDFGQGATAISEGVKLIGSTKSDLLENTDALLDVTRQVLILSNAASIPFPRAAQIATTSLNIWGKSAAETAKFVDILAAGSKFGASEVEDTGEAVLRAGPVAAAAGISFLELTAALQAVAESGLKANVAGTALGTIISRLMGFGIDFKKLGMQKAFVKLRDAFEKIPDPAQRAQIATKLFGREHLKVALNLLKNVDFMAEMEEKLRTSGVAMEQARVNMGTLSFRAKQLGATLDKALIRTFNAMEPAVSEAVVATRKYFTSFSPSEIAVLNDSLQLLKETFVGIGVVLREVVLPLIRFFVRAIAGVLSTIRKVTRFIAELAAAITTLDFSQFTVSFGDVARSMSQALGMGDEFFGMVRNTAIQATKLGNEMVRAAKASLSLAAPGTPGLGRLAINAVRSFFTEEKKTTVDVNIRAPRGTVDTNVSPNFPANVGVNMVTQ